MYGTLGYIDNGRVPARRDSNFQGATANPARRDMYGARRATDAAVLPSGAALRNTIALIERRCMFLEEQEKRRGAEVSDMRARLLEVHIEMVMATTIAPTVQVLDMGETAVVGSTTDVASELDVHLQYPMKRLHSNGTTQVWMRRRHVDPMLATVTYSWLLLFEECEGKPDRVLVGKFR